MDLNYKTTQPSCGCWRSYWEPCKSNYSGCSQKCSYLCTRTELLVFKGRKICYCSFPLNFTYVEHSRLVHIETRFVWFRTEWRGVWVEGSYGVLAGRRGFFWMLWHRSSLIEAEGIQLWQRDLCKFKKKSALDTKHWTACFAVMFCTLNFFENGELDLSPHLTAPINSPYWANEQSLPVNPICRKGVFSILLVTGSVGHLRTVLTKMALISLSTARPIHPNTFMMRSAGQDSESEQWCGGNWQLSFYTASLNLMCGPAECTFF